MNKLADREAIARIIAPEVWAQHDRFGKFTPYTQGMGPSLEKADAILALVGGEASSQLPGTIGETK